MTYPETNTNQKTEANYEKPKAKPEPIENWENEGGNVVPTSTSPTILFPTTEKEEFHQESPNDSK